MGYKVELFDGTDDPSDSGGDSVAWMGGQGVVRATADTWAGVFTLQTQMDDGTWIDVDGVSMSENGQSFFRAPMGRIRGYAVGGQITNCQASAERVRA